MIPCAVMLITRRSWPSAIALVWTPVSDHRVSGQHPPRYCGNIKPSLIRSGVLIHRLARSGQFSEHRAMKDWPDPNEKAGSKLLLYIEFWGLAALSLLAIGASYGPRLVDWMSAALSEI